ncbi:MAG: hypothetical protein QM762_28465 [Chryseolinea sp.]
MYSQLVLVAGFSILVTLMFSVIACILSYRHFRKLFKSDVRILLQNNPCDHIDLLTESDLVDVPEIVRMYIRQSGAVNKPKIVNFRVALKGSLRQSEELPWMSFSSKQYNGVVVPARLFFMEAIMKRLPVAGYHRYMNGSASMDIRLLSLVRVQHSDGPLMNTAETVTMFNDMCVMAPGTLIDKRISWIGVYDQSVTATFSNGGVTISADLHFNRSGELVEFISHDRYALQRDGSMQRYPWLTPLTHYHDFNGIRIASQAEAILKYPAGDFCYGKFNVDNVSYNV